MKEIVIYSHSDGWKICTKVSYTKYYLLLPLFLIIKGFLFIKFGLPGLLKL